MITGNAALTLRVAAYSDLAELDALLDSFLTAVVEGYIHV
jgi:hypothetical protein